MFKTGLLHVYYGDGKGKTSAVAGLAVRAAGAGCKVLFAQFLKNGCSSELKSLKLLTNIEVAECTPCTKFFVFMNEQEKAEACKEQHDYFECIVKKAQSGYYDLLVMDEVIDVITLEIIGKEELLIFLKSKPASLEVALTGHSMFPELLELADYASEVRKVKHPYDKGIKARKGIDM
jgi:cob(I)alamin adenosyltransferase